MDEDLEIINSNTRNEKIKIFFLNNQKKFIISFLVTVILILSFYIFQIYKDKNRIQISDKYNSAIIEFNNANKQEIILSMKQIIEDKDSTYSPLALYFLLDNKLIDNNNEINNLFDVVINETSLENEIRNLVIYKKALFNANFVKENKLLEILSPIINSESIWRSHGLYLIAEYFYSKNEKQKAKEFFEKIILIKNANQDIILEAQKRLNRDLSE
jgi:predicted negative regulator of RcsB-dependent stress response